MSTDVKLPQAQAQPQQAAPKGVKAALVNHVSYTCPDFKQAGDWYSKVFNLDQVGLKDTEVTLPFGKKGEQPYNVTAAAGYDAISHAVESFVTTRRNAASQCFALEAWRLLARNYERVLHDPNARGFNVDELSLPAGVDGRRVEHRQEVLRDLDARSRLADRLTAIKGMTEFQTRAVDLLTSPATKKAFALHEESPKLRDRYGRNTYGQSVLLARRLVEAGVRFVTVYYSPGIGGWDTHKDNFSILKNSRLPHTDAALSALLDDLSDRGLLGETLVYWTGDFGRTPKLYLARMSGSVIASQSRSGVVRM